MLIGRRAQEAGMSFSRFVVACALHGGAPEASGRPARGVVLVRVTGALYKASGWSHVGTTQSRGRYDRHTKRDQPKKDIWLRPLRKDWKRTLNR